MPKSGEGEGESIKGFRITQRSLDMFARYLQERAKSTKTRKKNEEIAEEFDVAESTVWSIKRRHRKAHVPD